MARLGQRLARLERQGHLAPAVAFWLSLGDGLVRGPGCEFLASDEFR